MRQNFQTSFWDENVRINIVAKLFLVENKDIDFESDIQNRFSTRKSKIAF